MTTTDVQTTAGAKVPPSSWRGLLRRIARTVGLALIVVVSLLVFPSVLPWMVAFWLAWHTVSVLRGKPGWAPLMACVVILLAKRVYWAPSLIVLSTLALVVALERILLTGSSGKRFGTWPATLCLWLACAGVFYQWHAIGHCDHPVVLDLQRPVVCIGDSLTSGLLPDRGYPEELKKLITLPVVNLGQSGITSEGGLERLGRIAEANPQVVVVELGGHDFLKGFSRDETKANVKKLMESCRELGAEIVLMEVPRGFMTDPFAGLEREIAAEEDVQLVPDSGIRQLVLWSPIAPPGMWLPDSHLSDDGIHTNRRGNVYLARYVASALEAMYGPAIRVEADYGEAAR